MGGVYRHMKNKNILITISEGSIARNIIRAGVPEFLLRDQDVNLYLLVPEDKAEAYQKEFGSGRVNINIFRPRPPAFFDRLLFYLGRNGLWTETIVTDQKTRFLSDRNLFSFFVKRVFIEVFGRSSVFHRMIRVLAALYRPSEATVVFFKKVMPALVFATDVQDEMDIDVLAAAKSFGIRTVGMVRSWDNLTSSAGLVKIIPDVLLVWNPYIREKAIQVQHIDRSIIKIVGIPHYDWYVKTDLLEERAEFLRKFGLEGADKLILFAGIGDYHAPRETEVAELLSRSIKDGELPDGTRVIFRPHPNFMVAREKVKLLAPNTVFDDGVATYTGKTSFTWEMDAKKMAHLMNSIYHADLIITTASTITIDAVAFSKPVICVAFDGKGREPYWKSVKRYYHNYTHYIDLGKTGGFKIAYSHKELIKYVNEYFKNPSMDYSGRKKIFEEFIWRLDGKSAERVASAVLEALD